jgi:hypothetical protein
MTFICQPYNEFFYLIARERYLNMVSKNIETKLVGFIAHRDLQIAMFACMQCLNLVLELSFCSYIVDSHVVSCWLCIL